MKQGLCQVGFVYVLALLRMSWDMLNLAWGPGGCWAPPLLNRLMLRRLVWGLVVTWCRHCRLFRVVIGCGVDFLSDLLLSNVLFMFGGYVE